MISEPHSQLASTRARPSGDLVALYLRKISARPLLTREGEVALFKQLEAGRRQVRRAQAELDAGAPAGEHQRLERAIQAGERLFEQSRAELVLANLRLVVYLAKKHTCRGMSLLDRVQEGTIGLMMAVDRFDHTLGHRLSTYAGYWIRQAIIRSIGDQARTVRLPRYVVRAIDGLNRSSQELAQRLGREPAIEELASRAQLSVERVRALREVAAEPLSLEAPVGFDQYIGDRIEDQAAVSPQEASIANAAAELLRDALSSLSSREVEVLRMRCGLGGGDGLTLKEVGHIMGGVTRERIRQIEARALEKLRRHPRVEGLDLLLV